MKTRVITGSIIGLICAGFFGLRFVSPYIFDIMIAIIMVCGAGEVSKVFNRSGRYNNMTLGTIFPVTVFLTILLGVYFKLSFVYVLLIELALFVLFSMGVFLWTLLDKKAKKQELLADEKPSDYVIKKTLLSMMVFAYPSLILSSLFYINHLTDFGLTASSDSMIGFFVLLVVFVSTMLTDVCAYFVGSTIKGKKLCPYISPNKTVSGAIGGLIGSVIGCIVLYFVFLNVGSFATIFADAKLSIWLMVGYSLIASVVSQAGDIFASWLKRTARTKDFSTIFPGHGGFMDRCDGLAFNALFSLIVFALIF